VAPRAGNPDTWAEKDGRSPTIARLESTIKSLSAAWLLRWTAGGSVRLKRPMRRMGGSVRLKRLKRRMGGSCALSALCAIRVDLGGVSAGFRLLCFGPKTCGLVSKQLSTPTLYGGECWQRAGRVEWVLSECHDMKLPRF